MNNDIITELLMCEDLGSKRLLTFDEEQAIFKLLKMIVIFEKMFKQS